MFNYVKQAGLLVTLLFVMSGAYASDIEEVIVVGAKVKYSNSNPESESNDMVQHIFEELDNPERLKAS